MPALGAPPMRLDRVGLHGVHTGQATRAIRGVARLVCEASAFPLPRQIVHSLSEMGRSAILSQPTGPLWTIGTVAQARQRPQRCGPTPGLREAVACRSLSAPGPSMSIMTNETNAALQQASESLAVARADANREIEACLAQIAADLPTRAAETAKRIAVEQPEVTKALGKDGVAKMRAELQAAAEDLGRQFVDSADEVNWPIGYSRVDNRLIHSALFKRFYGHTGTLSKVLTSSGYKLGESEPFLPQSLYTESKFTPLAEALTKLGVATAHFDKAKKADNDATVDDLWGD